MSEANGRPRKRFRILRWLWRGLLAVVVLVGVVAVAGGTGAYLVYDHVTRNGSPGEAVRVEVPPGATGADVARMLEARGLVEHEALFRLAAHLDGHSGHIKHGRYDLPRGLSPTELLDLLYEGPNAPFDPDAVPPDRRVTIPEGLTLRQMAALFDDPEAFLEAASDPALIDALGIEADTLEGYLLPDTYFFDAPPTEKQVVERMAKAFRARYERITEESPPAADLSLTEVVTIASLVEEEARIDEERPVIAGVIYNRLDRGMPLEFDSTLQYALDKYGQRLLYEDREVDSPYNTYRNPGLPPGPISNPGVASLRAALAPEDSDYLFFVSNADGTTHTFSETLREHNRAVARYRREMAEQRRRMGRADSERTDVDSTG
jgi:UPF0755 protein